MLKIVASLVATLASFVVLSAAGTPSATATWDEEFFTECLVVSVTVPPLDRRSVKACPYPLST